MDGIVIDGVGWTAVASSITDVPVVGRVAVYAGCTCEVH